MYVVNFVNSFIGRPGNIGLRTSYILNLLRSQGIIHKSVSRGYDSNEDKLNTNMGVWGQLPRVLNAYRIYFDMRFNHRIWDIKLFEYFCLLTRKFWLKEIETQVKIAHIWEYSPKVIKILKENSFKVVLDVPMAPTTTSRKLIETYGRSLNLHPHDSIEILELHCFAIADFIIAPSDFVKNEIVKLNISPEKIFVIPFGANSPHRPLPARIANNKPQGKAVHFCFAGNISPRKGIDTLLEAWNHPVFKEDTLHLCGRLYPDMVNLISKFNFKNIRTPGFVDIQKYFRDCDVYVFPSFLEGSSKSVYEAMACGLPSIVTPNTGSIVRDGQDGFIIEPGNPEALRAAMVNFKEHPNVMQQMGASAADYIRDFSWARYAESVLNVYRSIASNELSLSERRV